jgi:phosphoenolpyruvate carboxylase
MFLDAVDGSQKIYCGKKNPSFVCLVFVESILFLTISLPCFTFVIVFSIYSGGALKSLLDDGHSPETIFDALTSQQVELVLTAHPTEVNRRTILEKQRRVQKILTKADYLRERNLPSTGYAQSELDKAMKREIASTWQTDEVAREKPTPQNEAERGTLVVETVLWRPFPPFCAGLTP